MKVVAVETVRVVKASPTGPAVKLFLKQIIQTVSLSFKQICLFSAKCVTKHTASVTAFEVGIRGQLSKDNMSRLHNLHTSKIKHQIQIIHKQPECHGSEI